MRANCPGLGLSPFKFGGFNTFGTREWLTGQNPDVTIFPNPSSGLVNIQHHFSEIEKIEVVNVLGKVVYSKIQQYDCLEQSYCSFIVDLPAGQYLVKIYSGNSVAVEQLVLTK